MKSLSEKQKSLEKRGLGFYSPEYVSFNEEKTILFNELVLFINKLGIKNGVLIDPSYYYDVFNQIFNGEITFSKYKKTIKLGF
jgi:hypothetical protein